MPCPTYKLSTTNKLAHRFGAASACVDAVCTPNSEKSIANRKNRYAVLLGISVQIGSLFYDIRNIIAKWNRMTPTLAAEHTPTNSSSTVGSVMCAPSSHTFSVRWLDVYGCVCKRSHDVCLLVWCMELGRVCI